MKNEINFDLNNNNFKPDIAYFYSLDSENRICFDCGGAFPCCVSINNGVFLCKFCGENHRKKLNFNISFIREINDDWDEYLLAYATRGGNSRFKRLCLQYEVPCQSLTQNDDEKINKYIIRLGEYNRLVLKSEVNCDEPPKPLYKEVANNPIQNVMYFPEFENYKLFKGNVRASGNNNLTNNGENDSTGAKIWNGTKTTFNIMKTTTGIIYNTSKPIVSFLGNAAFNGLKYVGTSVWNYMNNNETTKGEGNNAQNNQTNDENNKNKISETTNQNNNYNYNSNLNNNFNNNPNNINNNDDNNFNNNINNLNNNYNYNNIYQNNNNLQNKNYLPNSNKHNIYTINTNGIKNNIDNKIPKPSQNYPSFSQNKNNNNNNIPNFYDINSINNESVNNITFYLNNNNNNSLDISKVNNVYKKKNSLLKHENIIVNDKYINNKNFLINNDNKEKNIFQKENNINNININENTPINLNNRNHNINNEYPDFNKAFNNKENNISINDNDIIMNKEIFDKNVPNIIGEEINQEKARYPIFQSANLLEDNSFMPTEAGEINQINKNEDNTFLNTPNN